MFRCNKKCIHFVTINFNIEIPLEIRWFFSNFVLEKKTVWMQISNSIRLTSWHTSEDHLLRMICFGNEIIILAAFFSMFIVCGELCISTMRVWDSNPKFYLTSIVKRPTDVIGCCHRSYFPSIPQNKKKKTIKIMYDYRFDLIIIIITVTWWHVADKFDLIYFQWLTWDTMSWDLVQNLVHVYHCNRITFDHDLHALLDSPVDY